VTNCSSSIWFSAHLAVELGIALSYLYVFSTFATDYAHSSVKFRRLAVRAGTWVRLLCSLF
jgi:hypothetical protein